MKQINNTLNVVLEFIIGTNGINFSSLSYIIPKTSFQIKIMSKQFTLRYKIYIQVLENIFLVYAFTLHCTGDNLMS